MPPTPCRLPEASQARAAPSMADAPARPTCHPPSPAVVSSGRFSSFPDSARFPQGGVSLTGIRWLAGSGGAAARTPLLLCVGPGNRPWPPAELQHLPRAALTAFKGTARNRCGHPAARVGLAASACPFSSLSVHFPRSVPADIQVKAPWDAAACWVVRNVQSRIP